MGAGQFYYQPVGETAENRALMRLIDAQFLETPWYGSRQMARHLRRDSHEVGRKRVRRLMALMGLVLIYQRPRTTVPNSEHRIWPYLLRGMVIDRPNQVWYTDTAAFHAAEQTKPASCPQCGLQPTLTYELIPNMPEHRLIPLMEAFEKAVSAAPEFSGLFANT